MKCLLIAHKNNASTNFASFPILAASLKADNILLVITSGTRSSVDCALAVLTHCGSIIA